MTKTELVKVVAGKTGFTQKDVKAVKTAMLEWNYVINMNLR